jgi:hypothetical protein
VAGRPTLHPAGTVNTAVEVEVIAVLATCVPSVNVADALSGRSGR